MKTIGESIRHCRESAGFTQKELAELCGTSKNLILRYEHGTTFPGIILLVSIADVLEISLDELIGRTPPRRGESKNVEQV